MATKWVNKLYRLCFLTPQTSKYIEEIWWLHRFPNPPHPPFTLNICRQFDVLYKIRLECQQTLDIKTKEFTIVQKG
jgi:hypothetical protein